MCVCMSTFSNIFSETTGSIEAKFRKEDRWDGGTIVYANGAGHVTKMAAITSVLVRSDLWR